MIPGACKIGHRCNVLHVPIQIKPLGVVSPPWRIKIAMACLWIIFREESQTVCNSPLALLQPDVKPTQTLILHSLQNEATFSHAKNVLVAENFLLNKKTIILLKKVVFVCQCGKQALFARETVIVKKILNVNIHFVNIYNISLIKSHNMLKQCSQCNFACFHSIQPFIR